MMDNIQFGQEAKAWVRRSSGLGEIVRVVPDVEDNGAVRIYRLYAAYEDDYLGCILFDRQGYWIYDGSVLSIAEQEQVGKFIIGWNN